MRIRGKEDHSPLYWEALTAFAKTWVAWLPVLLTILMVLSWSSSKELIVLNNQANDILGDLRVLYSHLELDRIGLDRYVPFLQYLFLVT